MLGRGGVVGRGQRVQGRPGPSFYSRHAPFKLVFLLTKDNCSQIKEKLQKINADNSN
jgi:hypothetical protein